MAITRHQSRERNSRTRIVPAVTTSTGDRHHTSRAATVNEAIRTRRTHKAYLPDPVPPAVLGELFELARWAPNHHLTNPWRFRVLGPSSLERLKAVAEADRPGSGRKLDRAPTLVAVTVCRTDDEAQNREDMLAGGVAAYVVLLAAHARGLAGYWRTVGILDQPEGRQALGIGDDEVSIGLLHLGRPLHEAPAAPERVPAAEVVLYLD
jgi:nitroreductase